jgi:uncharacterized surface protein with fasciclin (FAS1) repeats
MRKAVFLIFLLAYHVDLLAQTTNKTDSSLQQVPKQLSLSKTEGAAMLSTNDAITNIARSPELQSFYNAIQNAGLAETFRSKGPITIFAPANQGFDSLAKGKKDTLMRADHKYELIALITYHTMAGIVTAKDIARAIRENNGTATFTTLTGNKLIARLDNNRNIVLVDENGGQSIVSKFDVPQSNGLLHIIKAVLIPRFKTI